MGILAELRGAEACKPALEWIKAEGYTDLRDVWDNCKRGDWLLWFVYILDVDPKLIVRTAIECARIVVDTPRGQRRKELLDDVALAESWLPADIKSEHAKLARQMVEVASHHGRFAGPDLDVLQSMVEIVRQRIPWATVEARVKVVDGKLMRNV